MVVKLCVFLDVCGKEFVEIKKNFCTAGKTEIFMFENENCCVF
jgi:hypothetical protein